MGVCVYSRRDDDGKLSWFPCVSYVFLAVSFNAEENVRRGYAHYTQNGRDINCLYFERDFSLGQCYASILLIPGTLSGS